MCQKIKAFKQFHAVIVTSSQAPPRSLYVFNHSPSSQQVTAVVEKYLFNMPLPKYESVPFIYTEKPRVEVVPINISRDILF
jgi:hypothetical protein